MATDSAEAILRAARRARRDAEKHLAEGDTEAAEALFEAIDKAGGELRGATARIRQSIRPLSVSGFGESHDRLNDAVDSLHLTVEQLGQEDEDELDQPDPHELWEEFVEQHPELTAPTRFTDEELLAALRATIERREQPWLQGAASSGCVLRELSPDPDTWDWGKSQPSVTGKQLARLAREGKVVRLRRKWTKGRGDSIWSLPGIEINEWWFKQYEVEHG